MIMYNFTVIISELLGTILMKFEVGINIDNTPLSVHMYMEGILPNGPYPPCLCMADRALLAGYLRYLSVPEGHRF